MNEGGGSYKFNQNILKLSVEKKNIENAISEWDFLENLFKKLNKNDNKEVCICGHIIKNIYFAINNFNNNIITLGSECIKYITGEKIKSKVPNLLFLRNKLLKKKIDENPYCTILDIKKWSQNIFSDIIIYLSEKINNAQTIIEIDEIDKCLNELQIYYKKHDDMDTLCTEMQVRKREIRNELKIRMEEKIKKEQEEKIKKEQEEKIKKEQEEKIKKEQEEKIKKEQEEKIKKEQEEKIKKEQEIEEKKRLDEIKEKIKKKQESEKIKKEQKEKIKKKQESEKIKKEQEEKIKKEQEEKIKKEQEIEEKKRRDEIKEKQEIEEFIIISNDIKSNIPFRTTMDKLGINYISCYDYAIIMYYLNNYNNFEDFYNNVDHLDDSIEFHEFLIKYHKIKQKLKYNL